MTKDELKRRTKSFHISVIKACNELPKSVAGFELAKQLIRSGGSVGANYRAACRAKSADDFIYKIEIVIEEADESLYWLEVITQCGMVSEDTTQPLLREANEIVSIFVSAVKTAKSNRDNKKS